MKNTITGLIMPKSWYITRIIGRRRMFIITYGILFNALVWYIFSLVSPAVGESFIFNVSIISGVLTAGWIGFVTILGLIVTSPLVSITASVSYRTYKQAIAPLLNDGATQQRALPSGNNFDVYPDRIVVEQPFGNRSDFENEVRVKHETLPKNSWLFIFEFRRPYTRVADGSESGVFVERSDMAAPIDEDHKFESETPEQYYKWVSLAIPSLKAHMEKQRIQKTDKNVVSAIYQRTIVVLMLLFFAGIATAQTNTEKIKTAVSGNDFAPKTGQQVHYVFSDGSSATRTADGTKKISDLFATGYIGSDNVQRGELIGIAVDRSPVDIRVKIPATGTAEKPAALMKSHTAAHNEALPPQKSFSESLPDSAAVANTLNQAKEQIPIYKQIVFKMFKPVWEFAAWLFFFLCPLFGIALGFCNLVSRSARQNGNLGPAVADQQIRFAAAAWWISICVVGSAYICITASMFFWEWNPYVITSLCILGYIPAKWAINRLTPNGEYQETITTTRSNGRIGGGGGRQLGM